MRGSIWGSMVAIVAGGACGGNDDAARPMEPMGEMEEHGAPSGAACPDDQTLMWENFGERFMGSYCNGCHSSALTGASRRGAPVGLDFDRVASVRENAGEIDEHAAIGPASENRIMPPDGMGAAPSDDERRGLGEWLACGAPAVAPVPGGF